MYDFRAVDEELTPFLQNVTLLGGAFTYLERATKQ